MACIFIGPQCDLVFWEVAMGGKTRPEAEAYAAEIGHSCEGKAECGQGT